MTDRIGQSRSGQEPGLEAAGTDRLGLEGATAPLWGPLDGGAAGFQALVPDGRLSQPGPDAPSGVERLLAQATLLAAQGRRLEAVQSLLAVIEIEPKATAVRSRLADLLAQGGEVEEAIEQLSIAISLEAEAAPVWVSRGALYARSGRSKEAEDDFRQAIKRDATHYPAYRYLGSTLLRRGLTQDAVRVLGEAVGLAPQDAEARLALGEALAAAGDEAAAETMLEEVAALMATDPRPYQQLGRLFDRQGRAEEAVAMHRKAREVTTA